MKDEESTEQESAFSTSGDTPLDGQNQPVLPVADPVPGEQLDDLEDPDRERQPE